eukprot:9665-Heterococcus_DN1.PRE.1
MREAMLHAIAKQARRRSARALLVQKHSAARVTASQSQSTCDLSSSAAASQQTDSRPKLRPAHHQRPAPERFLFLKSFKEFFTPAEPLPLPHPALRTRLWKAVENQKWQKVKDLVALTEQRRGEDGLSIQDYLTILQAYAVGEQWTDFADRIETMRADPAIVQHEPVLAEMLGICAVGRQWDSALAVLNDMLENEIEPFLTSRANGFTGYGGFLRIALQDPDAVFLAAVRGGYNDI